MFLYLSKSLSISTLLQTYTGDMWMRSRDDPEKPACRVFSRPNLRKSVLNPRHSRGEAIKGALEDGVTDYSRDAASDGIVDGL